MNPAPDRNKRRPGGQRESRAGVRTDESDVDGSGGGWRGAHPGGERAAAVAQGRQRTVPARPPEQRTGGGDDDGQGAAGRDSSDSDVAFVSEDGQGRRSPPTRTRGARGHKYLAISGGTYRTGAGAGDDDDDEVDMEAESDNESLVSSTHLENNEERDDSGSDEGESEQIRPLIRSEMVGDDGAADTVDVGALNAFGQSVAVVRDRDAHENAFIDMPLEQAGTPGVRCKQVTDSVLVFEYTLREVLRHYPCGGHRPPQTQRGGSTGVRLRLLSPWIKAFGFQWRLLIFPQGNAGIEGQCMSVFLECSPLDDANDEERSSWRANARFRLALVNQTGVTPHMVRKETAGHMFSPRENDWGFQEFIRCKDLLDTKQGWIHDNALRFRVWVEYDKDSFTFSEQYDSKRETGYVGLKNQGATCYLNSLLQTLFNIGEFRRAVYALPLPPPTEADAARAAEPTQPTEPHGNALTLALQRVFYDLQHEQHCVSTKDLTNAYGWTDADTFMQHDVQELNRLLCDTLEERMKGTPLEGTIARLFQGRAERFIKCVNVEFESTRDDSFYDLSLNVRGCADIYDSFRKYIEVEMLDGDNKYQADGYGMQDAKMGVKFLKLAPVLQLHLKRFEFDCARGISMKINDRYAFYPEINLNEFVERRGDADEQGEENVYLLHAVLVHMGDAGGGHYHAYIQPDPVSPEGAGKWLKFDDERVLRVSETEACEDNFGAPALVNGVAFPPQKRFTNAYMLQYVRKSVAAEYLGAPSEAEVPPRLRERIALERTHEERRRRELLELRQSMLLRVVTPAAQRQYCGLDWIDFARAQEIRVQRSMTLGGLKELLAQGLLREELEADGADAGTMNGATGPPSGRTLVIWVCITRQNQTIRPSRLLNNGDDALPLERALGDRVGGRGGYAPGAGGNPNQALSIFVDVRPEAVRPETLRSKTQAMFLFKWFEPGDGATGRAPQLRVLGWDMVPLHITVVELAASLVQQQRLPVADPSELYWYEEVTTTEPKEIAGDVPLMQVQNQLQSGDIIVFGARRPSAAAAPTEAAADGGDVSLLPDMFHDAADYLRYHCDVQLRPFMPFQLTDAAGIANKDEGAPGDDGSAATADSFGEVWLHDVSMLLTQRDLSVLLIRKLREQIESLSEKRVDVAVGDLRPNRIRYHKHGFTAPEDHLYPRQLEPLPAHGSGGEWRVRDQLGHHRLASLYYEVLSIDLEEFAGMQEVQVLWRVSRADLIGRRMLLLLEPNATYRELVQAFMGRLPSAEREHFRGSSSSSSNQYAGVRVHELWQRMIWAACVPLDRPVADIHSENTRGKLELLVEPVPREETPEALAARGCVLIRAAHMTRSNALAMYGVQNERHVGVAAAAAAAAGSPVNNFGLPCVLRVPSPQEHGPMPVAELRELVRDALQVSEPEFAAWHLAIVRPSEGNAVTFLESGSGGEKRAGAAERPAGTQRSDAQLAPKMQVDAEEEQTPPIPTVDLTDLVVDSEESYNYTYLGLEHHDSAAARRRSSGRLRYASDKPLRIT